MRFMGGWSYIDLISCPDSYVAEIIAIITEQQEDREMAELIQMSKS